MIDVWTPKFDKHNRVWVMKKIDILGVEHHIIYDNNTIIAPHESTIAKEWVKNPEKYLTETLDTDADRVLSTTVNILTKHTRTTYEKNGRVYTQYCNENGCHTVEGGDENLPIECPAADGYTEVPHLFHTLVKPGKRYLEIKRCTKTGTLTALWRPGTYLVKTHTWHAPSPSPGGKWPMYNTIKWYEDDEGIHTKNAPRFRDDEIETLFSLDAPTFSVLHDTDGIDWIITPRVKQKIYTGAKTPGELYRKIFTGNYTFL